MVEWVSDWIDWIGGEWIGADGLDWRGLDLIGGLEWFDGVSDLTE